MLFIGLPPNVTLIKLLEMKPTFLITCFGSGIDNNVFAALPRVKSATSDGRAASRCRRSLTRAAEAEVASEQIAGDGGIIDS